MRYKDYIFSCVAVMGGLITSQLGGYTMSLQVLLVFMIADFVLGVLGAILNRSSKTENGGLSSKASFIGLVKKFAIIIFVAIGYNIDLLLNTTMVREMVIIGFSANELISIVEHAGVIGVPLPPVIIKVIEVLEQQAGEDL